MAALERNSALLQQAAAAEPVVIRAMVATEPPATSAGLLVVAVAVAVAAVPDADVDQAVVAALAFLVKEQTALEVFITVEPAAADLAAAPVARNMIPVAVFMVVVLVTPATA